MDLKTAPVHIHTCIAEKREPGRIYFTTRPGGLPNRAQYSWIVGVDHAGEIVLNRIYDGTSQDIRYIGNDRLLFSQSAQGILNEIDLRGNILRQWHATGKFKTSPPPSGSIPLPIDFMHHTVNILPNGNLLILDAESRVYDSWPTSTTDREAARKSAEIVGDVIVEVTPDGQLVHRHAFLDILDPNRISHGSMDGYWKKQGFPDAYDWCHSNAVAHDASDDTLIISVRHQDCIIKIRRNTGELVWILGNHSDWAKPFQHYLLQPESGLEWQYHQHDCSAPRQGRILCFDNGNNRAPAYKNPVPADRNYSRLVEFKVDKTNMTVRQAWSYGKDEEHIYGCYQGGALRLPKTGNTFGTFGGVCFKDGRPSDDNLGTRGIARLLEVTAEGQIVFDATIGDKDNPDMPAISAFRATHVPLGAR